MRGRQSLTEIAQQAWLPYLHPGAWAIDATAGNGQDTEFLARAVSAEGRVFAIDVQPVAIESTTRRLQQAGLLNRVTLLLGDHSRMRELLDCGLRGRINLVCFNLGYLPSGDHSLTTRTGTTIAALLESMLLLSPGGALSVIAYRAHDGGLDEALAVERFFNNLPAPWACVSHHPTGTPENPGPVWWMAAMDKG